MDDTRLAQALAALVEARLLLHELVEDGYPATAVPVALDLVDRATAYLRTSGQVR